MVQLDPINPTLKLPGTKRLKVKYDELLSNFGFKFNLRRYNLATAAVLRADHVWRTLALAQPLNALVFVYDGLIYAFQAGAYIRPHFSST